MFQTDPLDLSESNSNDPSSREEESSKEIISAGPDLRKNNSSEMNSSDTELRPLWKVLRDEDWDYLLGSSTQTLENVLQLCEKDPKTAIFKDNTVTIAVHHLTAELRRRKRAGAKLKICKGI